MKNLIKGALFALCCMFVGLAATFVAGRSGSESDAKNQIRSLTHTFHDALLSRDRPVLSQILAEEVAVDDRLGHSRMSRDKFISRIQVEEMSVASMVVTEGSIDVDNETARMECQMNLRLQVDGKTILHDAKYTYVYNKIDGSWRIVSIKQEARANPIRGWSAC